MIRSAPWFIHPVVVFIFSILALGLSLVLYIYWYIEVSTGLTSLVERFHLDRHQVFEPQTWVVILVLSILVGIILGGIFTIFVYSQKAVQLYRMQNNFINSFTHELKTPVTSLKLFLETFLKHDLSEAERQRYLCYMLTDVGRLGGTINRILDLARIESNSYGGEFVRADLQEETRLFFATHHTLFSQVRIELDDGGAGPLAARIDRGLFAMVLMNLTTNAIKYNASRQPRLRIAFSRNRRWLKMDISDNGIGLQRRELKRIFRKFYQIGRADDMSAQGTGLGLYLVQLIVRMHRGRIHAQSPGPGKGTTFILRLPPAQNGAKQPQEAIPESPTPDPGFLDFTRLPVSPSPQKEPNRSCHPPTPNASSSLKMRPTSPKA